MTIQGDVTVSGIIQSVCDVFETLFDTINCSTAARSVAALSGAVAVGIFFAVKDANMAVFGALQWSSGQADSRDTILGLVPGLQNLGNNCYLNVILQALASCDCFQIFLHQVIREFALEESMESMPFTTALLNLLEGNDHGAIPAELCSIKSGKVVLSPRKVMLAMANYVADFNLTSQQDAAEAFLHILCSLRQEFEACYVPKVSPLADIFASNCRILVPKGRLGPSEQERWKQVHLGPFYGALCSILTCQTCSSQISMSFESFDSLPISAALGNNSIRFGYSLMGCLKKFFIAEHIENYHCSHCWHIAAIKYLSLLGENEGAIDAIRRCTEQDSCDCHNLYQLEKHPWSNQFSRTLKQLSIACCPKILCIQLKRVSVNVFGELMKLQGHISFPLTLDIAPFMTARIAPKVWSENAGPLHMKLKNANGVPLFNFTYMQPDTIMSRSSLEPASGEINDNDEEYGPSPCEQSIRDGDISPSIEAYSKFIYTENQTMEKVDMSHQSPQEHSLYQLVSVVEHFGGAGSGHYTIYRCTKVALSEESSGDKLDSNCLQWFSVSDSEVRYVSEKEVLDAEASILFYEKLGDN